MRAVGLVVVFVASIAHANPAAEKLFQEGRTFLAAGKLPEACDSFRRSHDLWPRYATLMNLGDCEEKRGRIATAWAAFLQAGRLANQKQDAHIAARAAEAEKRAAALFPKLPHWTVRTPGTKPAGFTVKRDGVAVPDAELDRELPIDPGSYEVEAWAPGHVAWKQTIVVTVGQRSVVQISALAVDSAATTVATTTAPTTSPQVDEPSVRPSIEPTSMLTGKHRLGLGLAVGLSSDGDVIYGARFPIQLAALGTGALRTVPSVFYATYTDAADRGREFTLYALGLAVEYVVPLAPTVFVATGIGAGVDLISDNYNNPATQQVWGALRLSPTYRVGRALHIGLHVQLVRTKDNTVGLGELGVDYFFH